MTRLKTYYTVDEIQTDLYTTGSQWMTTNGVEYKGSYHTYTTGEAYTQANYEPLVSKKLVRFEKQDTSNYVYKQLKPDVKVKFKNPLATTVKINSANISAGVVIRYFLQKINDGSIIEIDSNQFDYWKTNTIDKTIYNAIQILWYITGNKQDTTRNGITEEGVITKNTNQLASAKSRMPGIETILNNPLQYYTDIDFIAPVDINGLDS